MWSFYPSILPVIGADACVRKILSSANVPNFREAFREKFERVFSSIRSPAVANKLSICERDFIRLDLIGFVLINLAQ